MSKQSRSGSSAAREIRAAAAAPPAGPESTVSAACPAASSSPVSPPLDCMIEGSVSPIRSQDPARRLRYPARSGDRAASTSVVAARSYSRKVPTTSCERDTWRSSPKRSFRASPIFRSWAGWRSAWSRQTATDSASMPATSSAIRAASSSLSGVSSPSGPLRSVGSDPAVRRDQGWGMGGFEPVEARPVLAPDLDQVGETGGRHQDGAGAPVLEQRVGGDGHAVGEDLDVARLESRFGEDRFDRVDDTLGLVLRRGRGLAGDDAAVADQDRVGEGATDVDPEDGAGFRHRRSRLRPGSRSAAGRRVRASRWPSVRALPARRRPGSAGCGRARRRRRRPLPAGGGAAVR